MSNEELLARLAELKDPLFADRSPDAARRVFDLYYEFHGEDFPRSQKCLTCAQDCFYILKYDSKHGTINGEKRKKQLKPKVMLTKYKLKRPFQLFGDPEYYTEINLTDEKAEKLMKANPAAKAFFEPIAKVAPAMQMSTSGTTEKPKVKRTRK